MKTLFRILGTAAAVAVTGAAIVVLDKILNQKDPLHVEEVEFPEDAEKDAEEAEKTAEAYEEAEAKEEAKAADAAAEAAEEAAPEAAALLPELEEQPHRKHPPLLRTHPRPSRRPPKSALCTTPKPRTPTPWRPAPLLPPRTRTARSTSPRSPMPTTSATGKSRAARAEKTA